MTARSRTYSWHDPRELTHARRRMSGLDFMRAWAEGRLPRAPIGETMDFHVVEAEEGRIALCATPGEFAYNHAAHVHGGYYATLLDVALGCAVDTTLPAAYGFTTLEFQVNMVRPMTAATGEIRVEGRVLHRGGRIATSEAHILDATGRRYAHGTTTCMILPPDPAPTDA